MTTINELLEASKIKDAMSKDVFVSPNLLGYSMNGTLVSGEENMRFMEWGKSQLCTKLGIPGSYIDKCPPELQGQNINHWLSVSKEEKKWMLRILEQDGEKYVRSVLTDKYSVFDNTDVLQMVSNVAGDHKHEIRRFYQDDHFDGFHMRLTFPEISYSAGLTMDGKPDELTFGLHIANSEVGRRSISITPFIYRLVCTNGLIVVQEKGEKFSQRHMGVQREDMPLKVAQAFEKALVQGEEQMKRFVDTKKQIVKDPMKAIADLVRRIKNITIPKDFTNVVQGYFATERVDANKATVYDIVNSFTRAAQTMENEDRRVALESFVYNELVAA